MPTSAPSSADEAATGALSLRTLNRFARRAVRDPCNKLAQIVLSKSPLHHVLVSPLATIVDPMVFSNVIANEGGEVTNQKHSGRCWLFALTNVLRVEVMKNLNLGPFQLSQSYLFFYDHLSKANWFLEQVIDTADEPIEERVVQHILNTGKMEAQDGGQYDMAVNLIESFGVVPQVVYPEAFNTSNTTALDDLLTKKLRRCALDLRALYAAEALSHGCKQSPLPQNVHESVVERVRALKMDQIAEVYKILAIACGTPPQPDETFMFDYYDKNKKCHRIESTPLEFYRKYVVYDCSQTISLVHDPRYPAPSLSTVDRLGNVVGGRPIRYLSVESDTLKKIVVDLIRANIPVWFGCDVDQASDYRLGVMDLKVYDMEAAFNTELKMTKAERLNTGESSLTHAMVFTGVHIDPDTGMPVRYRVENSWSDKACDKGFLVMTDKWFTEYVFQIAAPRSFVPRELLMIYDRAQPRVLPPWDPLGALA